MCALDAGSIGHPPAPAHAAFAAALVAMDLPLHHRLAENSTLCKAARLLGERMACEGAQPAAVALVHFAVPLPPGATSADLVLLQHATGSRTNPR